MNIVAFVPRNHERKIGIAYTRKADPKPSAVDLPVAQRIYLLMLRNSALSMHCVEHLREMSAPEPDEKDKLALEQMNYVTKLAGGRLLTPSGQHATAMIGRDLMLKFEKARRGDYVLTFERGMIAGLPKDMAATLLRMNGGVFGPSAAERIETHIPASERSTPDEILPWLVDAGLMTKVNGQHYLTERGRSRVQAAWRSCNVGWF